MSTPHSPTRPLSSNQLDYLAGVEKLLVAVDFDGTLAEFSDSPSDVRAVPGALKALRGLAGLRGTEVLIISGRQLRQLSAVTGLPVLAHPGEGEIRLVGSHGAEFVGFPGADGSAEENTATGESTEGQDVLRELGEAAEKIAATDPGMWVEYKPYSVGLHTRKAATPEAAEEAQRQLEAAAGNRVAVTKGRDILELSVATATKGSYLEKLRGHLGDPVVFFAGDDVTDETALRTLKRGSVDQGAHPAQPDVGVHVGGRLSDTTAAEFSLASPTAMAAALGDLLQRRRAAQG